MAPEAVVTGVAMGELQGVLKVGDVAPGQMRVVSVGGVDVVIANVGGTYCAFNNSCPHSEGPLGDGELDGDIVTCPWHSTRFNVRTGAVIEGETDDPVPVYGVEIVGDEVQVRLP